MDGARSAAHEAHATSSGARSPGIVLGIGLGGLLDGIVLHQILQWHHMLTSTGSYPADTVAGLEVNTLWDGLFHATAFVFVVAGVAMLWRASRRGDLGPGRALLGSALAGWGLFNLVEGVVDHQILGLHHVNESVPREQWILWDLAFLLWGAAMLVGGFALWRAGARVTRTSGAAAER